MKTLIGHVLIVLGVLSGWSRGQDTARVKIAQGEYRVLADQDLGVGPVDSEVFHFRETWTLWRSSKGNYEVEGARQFESPLGSPHEDTFWAQLGSDLRLTKVKEFTQLLWIPDSGPLTCDLQVSEMRCDSGGKNPINTRNIRMEMPRPYGILWPISVFSMGGLAEVAARHESNPVEIDLVTLNQLSKSVPVFTIRSRGMIRYVGLSETEFSVSGASGARACLSSGQVQPENCISGLPRKAWCWR